jgi:hypothetical protein
VGGIGYLLVAGRYRLEAVRKLRWVSIRAEIRDGLDAVQAELAEIDELGPGPLARRGGTLAAGTSRKPGIGSLIIKKFQ